MPDHKNYFNYSGKGKAVMIRSSRKDKYIASLNSKSHLVINDSGSSNGNDYLYIKTNKNNLRAFFNVDKEGSVTLNSNYKSDDLFIFNKSSLTVKNVKSVLKGGGSGFIDINNFFKNSESYTYSISNGCIEGIYADKKITNYLANLDYDYNKYEKAHLGVSGWITKIAGDVAGWLSKHTKYTDAYDVIQNGSTKDIESLLKVYTATKAPQGEWL